MEAGGTGGVTRDGERERDARAEAGAPAAGGAGEGWDGARVRALREHLRESQSGLAERVGTRQQTISEWETGAAQPRRMSRRLLHIVAEEGGFYSAERAGGSEQDEYSAEPGAPP